jgi:hypothetical protein
MPREDQAMTTVTTNATETTFVALVDAYRYMKKAQTGHKPKLKEARRAVRLLQAHGMLPWVLPAKGLGAGAVDARFQAGCPGRARRGGPARAGT